jgi:lipid A ethanolaminephosphotransferase
MSLKLFRVTEFAESAFFSPQAQRGAVHPAVVALVASVWLASVGNMALWQTLSSGIAPLPEPGSTKLLTGLALGVLAVAAMLVPVSLLCWRWTLKPGITLLLFAAALGTCLLWLQHRAGNPLAIGTDQVTQLLLGPQRQWSRFLNWECGMTLLLVALLPSLLLWRTPVRRIPPGQHVLMNAIFLIAAYALITGATAIKTPMFADVLQKHLHNPSAINPINTLVAAGRLASKQIALPAQQ